MLSWRNNMEFIDIPPDRNVCSASDLFQWEEDNTVNFKQLFLKYKDKLPMLICIQGGNYGTNRFDCYDNFQVLRINSVSYQQRVAADDTRSVRNNGDLITFPENTHFKFKQITGPNKYGEAMTLPELLPTVKSYPVNTIFAHQYPIRIASARHNTRDFEYISIKERYTEPYFMMNCIDVTDQCTERESSPETTFNLRMNPRHCMACLCDDLEAAPITGFRYKAKITFKEYMRQLTQQAATSGENYDPTEGNPDWDEHSLESMCKLLDVCEQKEGVVERVIDEPTEDDEYEEIAPLVPERRPVTKSATKPPNTTKIKEPNRKKNEPTTKKNKQTVKTSKSNEDKEEHNNHRDKTKGEDGGKGIVARVLHLGHKATHSKETAATTNEKATTEQIKELTSSFNDVVEEKVPERPAKPASCYTSGRVPPRDKKQPENKNSDVPTAELKNRDYQNTKVARATIKPIVKPISYVKKHDDNPKQENLDRDGDVYYTTPTEYVDSYGPNKTDEKCCDENDDVYEVLKECEPPVYKETEEVVAENDAPNVEAQDQPNTRVNEDVLNLSIDEMCEVLKSLKLGKYVSKFRENMIDGSVLCELTVNDMVGELHLKRLEAIRLHAYAKSGKIPT